MLDEQKKRVDEAVAFLHTKTAIQAKVAIVLGSGLGGLIEKIDIETEISYREIPNFPISTVPGHKGTLIFGKLGGVEVVVMNGRFHFYEGYTMREITFPEYVFKGLGVNSIVLSNAAGGINPTFQIGDIMLIRDHINFFGTNPLIGPNDDTLGPRFPDMHEIYRKDLILKAHKIAREENIHLQEGIYIGGTGPSFETPAEYKAFHILGADAVGMSTVPEAIVSNYLGMKVFALSVITNLGLVERTKDDSHEEVLAAADQVKPKMTRLIERLVPAMAE